MNGWEEDNTQAKVQRLPHILLKEENVSIPQARLGLGFCFSGYLFICAVVSFFYTYKCLVCMYACALPACLVPVEVRGERQLPLFTQAVN